MKRVLNMNPARWLLSRRLSLPIVTILAAAAATVLLSQGTSSAKPHSSSARFVPSSARQSYVAPRVSNVSPTLANDMKAFRGRPGTQVRRDVATSSDIAAVLSTFEQETGSQAGANVSLAQGGMTGAGAVMAVPASNGLICQASEGAGDCNPISAMGTVGFRMINATEAETAAGTNQVTGIVPDDVAGVSVVTAGGTATNAPVANNVFGVIVAGLPTAINYTLSDGSIVKTETHVEQILAEGRELVRKSQASNAARG